MLLLPVSHIPQRQQSDCLAACSAMILQHLAKSVRYSRLLKLLQVQSGGAVFSNLRHLARLGVAIEISYGDREFLFNQLENHNPVVVAVDTIELPYWGKRTYHAVVAIGFDEKFVYVNDPAFGSEAIRVAKLEFELAWLERDYMGAVIRQA